jgi:hypothetical protein
MLSVFSTITGKYRGAIVEEPSSTLAGFLQSQPHQKTSVRCRVLRTEQISGAAAC